MDHKTANQDSLVTWKIQMWNNLSIPYKNLLEAMTGTTILVEAEDGVIMRRSYGMS